LLPPLLVPNLAEVIKQSARIAVSYHLTPLDRGANTAAYIEYRLKLAALGPPLQFRRMSPH
jgi:type II secretory pathway predicted ATPase ExeA